LDNNTKNSQNNDDVDGYVWIIDGKVFVRNELKGGIPPAISPCEGCKLIINGEESNYLNLVNEDDKIELRVENTENEMKMEIQISDDGLQAYLDYTPAAVYSNRVIDKIPINRLDIEVDKTLIQSVSAVTEQQVMNIINQHGIVFGIIQSEIEKLCEANLPGKHLIAEGKAPVEPIDEHIEYFFNEEETSEKVVKEDTSGKVDYKDIFEYHAVNVGEVLALVHKGTLGKNGVAVTGRILIAREPSPVLIGESRSVEYNEATGQIKAIKCGKPTKILNKNEVVIQVVERISIVEVNIKTGNVNFSGDIEINGNVSEGMQVSGKNDIWIKGNVTFSNILAINNVYIKGSIVSAKVSTGVKKLIYKDASPIISGIINEMNLLISNVNSISKSEKQNLKLKSFPEIVRYVQNTKNRNLSKVMFESISVLKKDDYYVDEHAFALIISSSKTLLGDCSAVTDIDYLKRIVINLSQLLEKKETVKITGNVEVGYLLNSEIRAIGDVFVKGKGCINSIINADGKILVNGVIRGGTLSSQKSIEINKCGCETGVKTLLTVPDDGRIIVKYAYPDTTIKIGRQVVTLLKAQNFVDAKLVNGKIMLK